MRSRPPPRGATPPAAGRASGVARRRCRITPASRAARRPVGARARAGRRAGAGAPRRLAGGRRRRLVPKINLNCTARGALPLLTAAADRGRCAPSRRALKRHGLCCRRVHGAARPHRSPSRAGIDPAGRGGALLHTLIAGTRIASWMPCRQRAQDWLHLSECCLCVVAPYAGARSQLGGHAVAKTRTAGTVRSERGVCGGGANAEGTAGAANLRSSSQATDKLSPSPALTHGQC